MSRWVELLGELHEEFRRYEEQLKLLREIDIEIIRSPFNLNKIFELIINGSIRLISQFPTDLAGELLILKGRDLEIVWSSVEHDIGQIVSIDESVTGMAVLKRQSVIIPDVNKEPKYKRIIPDMRSELATPLKTNSHILGVINIESRKISAFNEDDKALLEMLASQAAIAIRNAMLYQDLNSVSEFQAMVLKEDRNLQEILGYIAKIAKQRVDADHCQILSIENSDLIIQYTTGEEKIGSRVKIDFSVSGKALKSPDCFVYIPDVSKEEYYQQFLTNMISELAVAVKIKDKNVGVINVESCRENAFDDNHIDILRFFADEVGIALSNHFNINDKIKALRKFANSMTMAAIGDRAANLVHKLHNYLAPIHILADEIEELLKDKVDNELVFELLGEIKKNADISMEIPKQMREAYTQKDVTKEIDVNKTIENALDTLKPPRNIKVTKALTAVKTVRTINQLDFVIYNLVKNAYQAMPEGGSLTIRTKVWEDAPLFEETTKRKIINEKGVEIEVEDTGIGMDKEELSKITDPTYTKRIGEKGLGFGLWWVSTFLERIGGEFVPDSNKGSGTRVLVRIPYNTELSI